MKPRRITTKATKRRREASKRDWLKAQGSYMGTLRHLPRKEAARIKAYRRANGLWPALARARTILERRQRRERA